jgi:hypothetical protein
MTTDPKALATPEMIAAAWDAWHSRHGGKLGPGPAFAEAINAALALAQPRPEQVEEEAARHRVAMICMEISEDRPPDNVVEMFRVYEGAEHWTLTKCPAGCGRCDVDRAYSHADRMIAALARPAPKPAGDADALMRAVRRAEDGAGAMPAKDAVKLRPADWHAVCDAARKLASPSPANAAPASEREGA